MMKIQKLVIIVMLAALVIFAVGCAKKEQLIGGDKDEHGCIGSAGYSWCESSQKCLRIWEENCTSSGTTTPQE